MHTWSVFTMNDYHEALKWWSSKRVNKENKQELTKVKKKKLNIKTQIKNLVRKKEAEMGCINILEGETVALQNAVV